MIEPKPYKLINEILHYDWGTKNENAFIPKLLGIEPEKDLPYAELWIGAHPKAPSKIEINDNVFKLDEVIRNYPAEILGEKVIRKFGKSLPFLLKILSCEKALSIQAHPDKMLAKTLHAKDPINYPDDNHKPEIAIAVDYLKAIVGLKPLNVFKEVINKYPALYDLADIKVIPHNEVIKKYYSELMRLPVDKLEKVIIQIRDQIQKTKIKSAEEIIFLEQFENYGFDVGLISILLFNYLELKEGEGIYTGAGIPHAYIKGNIIECMANSDNVVRAGLTPKYKDIDTLLEMMEYNKECPQIIAPVSDKKIYKTYAVEFELALERLAANKYVNYVSNSIRIGIVLDGRLSIRFNYSAYNFKKGDALLIPAILNEFIITTDAEAKYVIVNVP